MMYARGFDGFGGCFGYGTGLVGPWIIMGIGVLLLAAVTIAAMVLFKKASHKKMDEGALDILKLRYAKGEMSEEEYLRMKKVLGK
ncbi:SHOCT domain-containing protein [Sporolactobacillus laevolacticus]|uniref:SHOCT domain-containing protein n=1 Tax=Sporolactobacillus laevolacticus DSM 442 TaxID=1395513 RepID=V6IWF5_9BACL|nr:SHOCT domain-containing protein [Sporolactobacillus laevolacticus]EST11540.1 hypothetical protein P343_11225 [Sporolactobacillus laevolacticus DSM 442]